MSISINADKPRSVKSRLVSKNSSPKFEAGEDLYSKKAQEFLAQYSLQAQDIEAFRCKVLQEGARLYRDLPWRTTRDPYAIWISEVMLQQTQVSRVLERWEAWLETFPRVEALAAASTADVLEKWQGMGYNRRALALKRAAEIIEQDYAGSFPQESKLLEALPGIGPATAAGIRAFAFDLPGCYLETNVRSVILHELLRDYDEVSDKTVSALVSLSCPQTGLRSWYYAMLDYGAYLKSKFPNPSRRSKHHSVQSKFEGSKRQKRSFLLRAVLSEPKGLSLSELSLRLARHERSAGRKELDLEETRTLLLDLVKEGFMQELVQDLDTDEAEKLLYKA